MQDLDTKTHTDVMVPVREHRSTTERLTEITKRMEIAYAARGEHPVGTPGWWAADDQVAAVYVDLRAHYKEVHGR